MMKKLKQDLISSAYDKYLPMRSLNKYINNMYKYDNRYEKLFLDDK